MGGMIDLRENRKVTMRAEEDFTGKAGFGVKQGAVQNGAVLCDTDGERCLGVIKYPCESGEVTTIVEADDVACVSAGAVAIGEPVSVRDGGKFDTAAAGDYVFGVALTAATGADEEFLVRTGVAQQGVLPA